MKAKFCCTGTHIKSIYEIHFVLISLLISSDFLQRKAVLAVSQDGELPALVAIDLFSRVNV